MKIKSKLNSYLYKRVNKYYLLLIIAITFTLTSCEGPVGPNGVNGSEDKQIRIDFVSNQPYGAADTNWRYTSSTIINFNKNYYSGVDSIIFAANLLSRNVNTNCYAIIINLTDSVLLQESMVSTNDTTQKWCYSGNIINSLPNKEITLSICYRSSNISIPVVLYNAMILLYRK